MGERIVALDELVAPKLSVTLNGKEYPVKPLDGFGYQLLSSLDAATSVSVMFRIAQRVLAPGMSKDEVFGSDEVMGLTPAQVAQVVKVSSGQIELVEDTIPNGSGPLEEGQASQPALQESPRPMLSAS